MYLNRFLSIFSMHILPEQSYLQIKKKKKKLFLEHGGVSVSQC